MSSNAYANRRSEIETYFDRTAVDAWKKLTSDAPVSKIRATVRAGRDRMRETMLGYLPDDLTGKRVLDAGCGTGAFSIELAKRGAHVLAVDLSPTLVDLARDRLPHDIGNGHIDFASGDMLDPEHGSFDHVVAMDSMIHYGTPDIVAMLEKLAARTRISMVFTTAPRTPMLMAMHTVGRLFPRSDRAPSIVPVAEARLENLITKSPSLDDWQTGRTHRINSGFYLSRAQEILRT